MAWRHWLDRFAPDLVATVRRFPFAVLLAAGATAAAIASINWDIPAGDGNWWRWFFGIASGAVFALAGRLFAESRPEAPVSGLILGYLVPLLAIGAFHIPDGLWIAPYLLPVISVLWLSVSAFTRIGSGDERSAQQDRFWWLNHQAVATGLIAAIAFVLIALGIVAIERSLSILFGLKVDDLFYRFILPVIGLFFTPVYWLSTIPQLDHYDERAVREPDVIAKAIGFLGQFVLTPLLLVYAAILLVYTVEIVAERALPKGLLGWMALAFVITGAANWLVLYPAFMRERGLVRLFQRWWFRLTIVPLVLYALAIGVRIESYGLTPQRILLLAGGVWGGLLTLIFLLRRGDIRLIPALAGIILMLISVGPWNIESLPRQSQAMRLDALLTSNGVTGPDSRPNWNPDDAAAARSIIGYLFFGDDNRRQLQLVYTRHGLTLNSENSDLNDVLLQLGVMTDDSERPARRVLFDANAGFDISATPILIGYTTLYTDVDTLVGPIYLGLAKTVLSARSDGATATIDLGGWLAQNTGDLLNQPAIGFSLGPVHYSFVVQSSWIAQEKDGSQRVDYLEGMLFTDAVPKPRP
jgi:hypothetical protein